MGLFKGKGNSSQTVKAATTGNGRGRTTGSKKTALNQQEQIGAKYTQQKHTCTTGRNGCDSPCPLAHPTA